jgi:hypothetical protein
MNQGHKPGQNPTDRRVKDEIFAAENLRGARRTDLSIDEDLFQPLSPCRIDRLEQARARRRTATTATMSATTTTRSEKGQEDIYTRAGCFFFSDAGAVVVASGLPHTRLNPNPKRRRGAKGDGHASSADI